MVKCFRSGFSIVAGEATDLSLSRVWPEQGNKISPNPDWRPLWKTTLVRDRVMTSRTVAGTAWLNAVQLMKPAEKCVLS